MKLEDPDASLESLLRSTPLREPGHALDDRVNSVFAQYRFKQPRRFSFYKMALAAGLLIAAGVGIRLATHQSAPVMVAESPRSNPIRIERETSTVYDDGVVASSDDSTAYQKFRRRTVREIWYVDPTTHARATITIPSEQIVIQQVDAF